MEPGLFGIDAFIWCLSFDMSSSSSGHQPHFSFFVGLEDLFSHQQQQDQGIAKLIGLSNLHIIHPDIRGILLDLNIIKCPGFLQSWLTVDYLFNARALIFSSSNGEVN